MSTSVAIHKGAKAFKCLLLKHWIEAEAATGATETVFESVAAPARVSRLELGLILRDTKTLFEESLVLAVAEIILAELTRLGGMNSFNKSDEINIIIQCVAEQAEIPEAISGRELDRACSFALRDHPLYLIFARSGGLIPFILSNKRCQVVLEASAAILRLVDTMHLQNIWEEAPLLSGDDLKKVKMSTHIIDTKVMFLLSIC